MTHSKHSWGSALIDFFASLRLTIVLLIILAITSIIGTVIPQGEVPHEYLHSIGPIKLKLYQSLNLFDMYHSWWFIGTLTLFTINLVVCSAKRLPHVWRYISAPATVLDQTILEGLSQRIVVPLNNSRIRYEALEPLLRKKFGAVTVTETVGAVHLFSESTPFSRLAVYVTHLSIIVIFIGAIVGSLFGYKGFVTIVEGESVSSVETRSGKKVDLGFSVGCEDFSVAHYPNGAPKEFKSILTVADNKGVPVPGFTRVPVIVNDPLHYKGITFYQSSYGKLGEHSFYLSDPDGGNPQPLVIKSGGSAQLPDGSSICLLETTQDVSQFQPGVAGPAAQVEVHMKNGMNKTFVVFGTHAAMNRMNLPFTGGKLLQYRGGEEFEYTGLQVAKDPGVWIVWIGCILLIFGIYGAFLMSHRRIWVRVTDEEITIAGHADKNQGGFAAKFMDLAEAIRHQVCEEEKP